MSKNIGGINIHAEQHNITSHQQDRNQKFSTKTGDMSTLRDCAPLGVNSSEKNP
jgi:hypothetical protein